MYSNFSEVKKALTSGVSLLEIVGYYLKKIEETRDLNIYLEVFEKTALEQAKIIQQKISNKTAGSLAGMIIAIKDNICYKNHKVSASSNILQNFESQFTASALQKLIDQDVIVIGRTNCDEFAMGSSNENSAFGNVCNPLDCRKVPGGSSGGSAAAVKANTCTASLGSDTGGSIRQPASFTGTYGSKPTYGRVSRYGLIAYASSFDQIGVFSNSIEDNALLTEIISGKDEFDSTSSSKIVENFSSFNEIKNKKIAVFTEIIQDKNLSVELKKQFEELIVKLKNDGNEIIELSFPLLQVLVPSYYVLTTAEASSNLARFDGVHFGFRSKEAVGLEDTYKKSRSEGFGKEVKRRILAGTFVLSHDYYDAYYTKAQKVRRIIKNKTDEIFENCDFIISPTTPTSAFDIGAVNDPIQMYLQDIFTVHANLSGNPAISIPMFTDINKMPIGMQVIANNFEEKEMFSFSKYLLKFRNE